jgi:hypothetical protein
VEFDYLLPVGSGQLHLATDTNRTPTEYKLQPDEYSRQFVSGVEFDYLLPVRSGQLHLATDTNRPLTEYKLQPDEYSRRCLSADLNVITS